MINAVSYQFNKFVEFAEERVKAGKDTAIARTGEVRVGGGTPLEERAISASERSAPTSRATARRLSTSPTGRMSTSTGFSRRSSAEKGEERQGLHEEKLAEVAAMPIDINAFRAISVKMDGESLLYVQGDKG